MDTAKDTRASSKGLLLTKSDNVTEINHDNKGLYSLIKIRIYASSLIHTHKWMNNPLNGGRENLPLSLQTQVLTLVWRPVCASSCLLTSRLHPDLRPSSRDLRCFTSRAVSWSAFSAFLHCQPPTKLYKAHWPQPRVHALQVNKEAKGGAKVQCDQSVRQNPDQDPMSHLHRECVFLWNHMLQSQHRGGRGAAAASAADREHNLLGHEPCGRKKHTVNLFLLTTEKVTSLKTVSEANSYLLWWPLAHLTGPPWSWSQAPGSFLHWPAPPQSLRTCLYVWRTRNAHQPFRHT